MATKKETVTYTSLRDEIAKGKFRPIYVLHGEESYYIDSLSEWIVDHAIADENRDFNLTISYGNETTVAQVIENCKQYPVFAQRRVVVLREAQLVSKQPGHRDDLQLFRYYADKPLESTILVICHKGGVLKAKQFTETLRQMGTGVIFESSKVRDGALPALINDYCKSMQVNIDPKSVMMLREAVGSDLSLLYGQLDKLRMLAGEANITPELIEKNVGISKEYNYFELEDALLHRDAFKAFRIIDYFRKNPKKKDSRGLEVNSVQSIVPNLFGFFSNVLIVRTCRDKSPSALMEATANSSTFRIGKFEQGARIFSTAACVNIIHWLRECDVKSKGIGSQQDAYALLTELIYKILHA